jgi:membrane-bound serine protease (ClpP class)
VAWRAGWVTRALATVMGSVMATAVVGWGIMKVLPKTSFGRPLVLETTLPAGDGTTAPQAGESGEAATPLRPAGKVVVGGRRMDAVAEVGFVEAGARVRVVRAEAGRLVVREDKPS